MSDASAPELPSRQVSAGTRKMFVIACVIDLILAGGVFVLGGLAQATSPTGKGAWLEILVALAILAGAPAVGWSLYNGSRVDIRWIMLLVWAPIVLLAIFIPWALANA
jgi:hypothetical protein